MKKSLKIFFLLWELLSSVLLLDEYSSYDTVYSRKRMFYTTTTQSQTSALLPVEVFLIIYGGSYYITENKGFR